MNLNKLPSQHLINFITKEIEKCNNDEAIATLLKYRQMQCKERLDRQVHQKNISPKSMLFQPLEELKVIHYSNGNTYHGLCLGEERHGKGRLYDKSGILIYDGIFAYDKYNGYGKLKDITKEGRCVYIGWFENNEYHGYGDLKEEYNGATKFHYIGEFNHGNLCGKAKVIKEFVNGEIHSYMGEVVNYEYHGKGRLIKNHENITATYKGKFVYDEFDTGILSIEKGSINYTYTGIFTDNELNGEGVFMLKIDSAISQFYVGEFCNNKFHGKGILTCYDNGNERNYDGNFTMGKFNG